MSPPKGFVVETAEGRKFEIRGVATKEEAYEVFLQQQGGSEAASASTERNPVGPQPAFSRYEDQVPREPTPPEDQYDVENLRYGAVAGTAMTGAALGTPAGPLGMLAGGALGAGLGYAGFTGVKEVAKATGVVGPGSPLGDSGTPLPLSVDFGPLINPSMGALEEIAMDLVVPAVLRSAGRGVMSAAKRVAGVSGEHATTIIRYAKELGIPIGLEAVSETGFVAGGARATIGKFPWLGTAFTRSNKAVAGGLFEVRQEMLHEVAPFLTTLSEQGVELSTAQLKRGKAASRMFSGLYEGLMTRAEAAGAKIPTGNVKEIATGIVKTWRANMPKKVVKGVNAPIESLADSKLVDWAADNLMNLTDNMTPRQYQRLSIELNAIISGAGDNRLLAKHAAMLKKGLQKDLEQISSRRGNFSAEIKNINKRFGDWQKLLKTATGKKFGRASNTGYDSEINQEGAKAADTMFKEFFNAGSPQGMRELRQLVGARHFRSAVRTHLESAFDLAVETTKDGDFFSIKAIRKNLGLGRPKSPEYRTLATALEEAGTGVKISDLDKYFAVAEAHFKLGVIDVSQFVARRAQLGGARTAARTLIPGMSAVSAGGAGAAGVGAATGGTLFAMIGAVASIKGMANLLTNPRYLKAVTVGLSKSASKEMKQRATTRAMRLVLEHATVLDREAGTLNMPAPSGQNQDALMGMPGGQVAQQLDRLNLQQQ